jgi:hypothetical protein
MLFPVLSKVNLMKDGKTLSFDIDQDKLDQERLDSVTLPEEDSNVQEIHIRNSNDFFYVISYYSPPSEFEGSHRTTFISDYLEAINHDEVKKGALILFH